MGVSKVQAFSERHNRVAQLAKALAHPARVAILEYLIKNPGCITGDLVDELPLSQSTVSQHLKELKQVGIIRGEVEAPKVCYCINEQVWSEFKDTFLAIFKMFDPKCC